MNRIDTLTKAIDLFGSGKHGFRDGVAPGLSSTGLNAKWFNAVQENICRAIEAAGIALVEGDHTQLTAAIRKMNGRSQLIAGLSRLSNTITGTAEVLAGIALAPNPDRIVVCGENAALVYGYTSMTVATAAASYAGDFKAVAYDPVLGAFAAVGTGAEVQTSPTGQTWTRRNNGSGTFKGIASNGAGTFVACGVASLDLYRSTALSTWTHVTGQHDAEDMNAIAFGAGLFVAVGTDGAVQSSPDGSAWTARSAGSTTFIDVQYMSGVGFVALTNDSNIRVSLDGITWSSAIFLGNFSAGGDLNKSICVTPYGIVALNPQLGVGASEMKIFDLTLTPSLSLVKFFTFHLANSDPLPMRFLGDRLWLLQENLIHSTPFIVG